MRSERGGLCLLLLVVAGCTKASDPLQASDPGRLSCEPATLDLGATNFGTTVQAVLTCRNDGDGETASILARVTEDDEGVFEVRPSEVGSLQPGQSADFEVRFEAPPFSQLRPPPFGATLLLGADQGEGKDLEIGLTARVGGPDIDSVGRRLIFGPTMVDGPGEEQSIVLFNLGFEPLIIESVEADLNGTSAFELVEAPSGPIPPTTGEGLRLRFSPPAAGPFASTLRITSNDRDTPQLDIPLEGEGIDWGPCQATAVPDFLDFGDVEGDDGSTLSFVIRNPGPDPCLVSGPEKSEGGEAFSEPAFERRRLEPEEEVWVDVSFRPEFEQSYGASLRYELSGNASSPLEIPLSGRGQDPGINPDFEPKRIDFGQVAPGCRGRDRPVRYTNRLFSRQALEETTLSAGAPFAIVDGPTPPIGRFFGLEASAELSVGFAPTREGLFASALRLRIGTDGPFPDMNLVIPITGQAVETPFNVETFVVPTPAPADVLFVVDRAAADEHVRLAEAFPSFVDGANAADYRVAITTTDVDRDQGRFISATPGTVLASSVTGPSDTRVITPSIVPSPESVFRANVSMAEPDGSPIEQAGLEAAYQALTSPQLQDHNAGLLRSNSNFAVVFVSSEPDQSGRSDDHYANFILLMKGASGRSIDLVTAHTLAAPFPPGDCDGPIAAATSAGRHAFLSSRLVGRSPLLRGQARSYCEADRSAFMEALAEDLFGQTRIFELKGAPVVESLEVFVDEVLVPTQDASGSQLWRFDLASNAVRFPRSPPAESVVRIQYDVSCL
ncbi:MAG: hypothetical protein AAF851_20015 [Myxococcota bacterium]